MTGGRPVRVVIFDMDGVLTDSEPAFHLAVNDILARYGEHISLEEYKRFIGMETPKMWAKVIELKHLPKTVDEIVDQYEGPLMARLREPRSPIAGARELLDELRWRRIPIGLCTASYARWTEAILSAAALPDVFDAKVTGDVITRAKPDREPYVLAASMLSVPPEECLVIEDSVSGVTSALAAGAVVIQLRATSTAAQPMAGVERVIDQLADFPMELLLDPVPKEG